MDLSRTIGIVLLVLAVVAVAVVAVRRSLLARSGSIDVCWRDDLVGTGRGWILGMGRYRDGEIDLYRSFSPLPLASRSLSRTSLILGERRSPIGTELDLLPLNSVVVRCSDAGGEFELALSEESLTGLRSWLESVPPGARRRHGGQAGLRG